MKLILFAHQNWGIKAINAFFDMKLDIAKVYTHSLDMDKHEKVWYDSIKNICNEKNIPVLECSKLTDFDIDEIKLINPDLIFSVGWRRLLPKSIFSIPKFGVLNLHDSLIPNYRGFAPINWSIINGEKETGLTIHYIDEGIDTGDIILQKKININFEDTAFDVYNRLLDLSTELFQNVIHMIEKNMIQPQSQKTMSQGFFCSRRFPDDGKIDWKQDRVCIYNLIRALCDPYPNAFFIFNSEKYFVKNAKLIDDDYRGPSGKICAIRDGGIIVTCGNSYVKNQALLISKISKDNITYDASQLFNKLWIRLL